MELYIYFKANKTLTFTNEIIVRYSMYHHLENNKGLTLLYRLDVTKNQEKLVKKLLDQTFLREQDKEFVHKASFIFHIRGGIEKPLYSKIHVGSILKNARILKKFP